MQFKVVSARLHVMAPLVELLAPHGAPPEGIIEFRGAAEPNHVRYLDLRSSDRRGLLAPHGVVEFDDGPLAYVFDATEKPLAGEAVPQLCRVLALRGDAPYLIIVAPGRLTVHGVALDVRRDRNVLLDERRQSGADLFHRLRLQPPPRDPRRRAVQLVLFDLFTKAVEGLTKQKDLSHADAISLAGRALFTRFLVDRDVIAEAELEMICGGQSGPEQLFAGAHRAESTCAWLDSTFNGDFLPLSVSDLSQLGEGAFWHLSNIMGRSPAGQKSFGWAAINFSYVPVEVLSQVYEWTAESWNPTLRKQRSMYFTPLRIARYMVREIFTALEVQGPSAPFQARVLDPAVGGGVFLVAAFREICAAWWRHHARPPKTQEIRSILETQLVGFDIHEPALRLAALGLYLTAIELDQDPKPVEKLGFSPLRGNVLFKARRHDEPAEAQTIGSLSLLNDPRHRGYDAVIGNPPWTSLSDKCFEDEIRAKAQPVHKEMIDAIRPIVEERLGATRARAFSVPDLVPDLPFLWAAMRWAAPGGWIGFALHARLLFKQWSPGEKARNDIFEAIDVTGILNGADLRETHVWPKMRAPFCLLFAKNQVPGPASAFYYVTPYRDNSVNKQSRLRIDAKSAHPIAVEQLLANPSLLKTLFRGTVLDADIARRIKSKKNLVEFGKYWKELGLEGNMGHGFQVLGPPDRKMHPADFLQDYPCLDTATKAGFLVDPNRLPKFSYDKLHLPRSPEIYLPPLLIIRESVPVDRNRCRAHVSLSKLAYNKSFYGYSASSVRDGELLVRYLSLLVHSDLFMWHNLMTSSRFGVERYTVEKLAVDHFPLIRLSSLGAAKGEIEPLSSALFAQELEWSVLDEWVAEIYGLDPWDIEVIRDSLSVGLSYEALKQKPDRRPDNRDISAFACRIQKELEPFVKPDSINVSVRDVEPESPWILLVVALGNVSSSVHLLANIYQHADALGASQIVATDPMSKSVAIAILRQYRYWTPTRARLLALEILDEHLDAVMR